MNNPAALYTVMLRRKKMYAKDEKPKFLSA